MNTTALDRALTFLDSWLAFRFRQLDLPGLSIAVYSGNQIVFSQAYGMANLERGEQLTSNHLFGVASQSKLFTSTAIMQLVGRGKLVLDTPVTYYLPWLSTHHDPRVQGITIRQLLSHQSGLMRDGQNADFWQLQRPFPTIARLRREVLAAEIVTTPRVAVKYSNMGFALLGQVVQAVTGQTYARYITEHIIRPLGLNSTVADYSSRIASRLATGYSTPFEQLRSPLLNTRSTGAFAGATGVHSTPEDMCRFAAAHFADNDTILDNALKEEMQRAWQPKTDNPITHFGLGCQIATIGSRRVIGHSGHMLGYLSATYFDPKQKLAVSVMANCKDAPSVQAVYGIFETLDFFANNAGQPTPTSLARLNVRLCSKLSSVEIVATKKRIVAIDPDDWRPFNWAEELKLRTPNILQIATKRNVFTEGELIHYIFDREAVRAVRYAGYTMLPEHDYQQQTWQADREARSQLVSFEDLQDINLRVGKIVKTEALNTTASLSQLLTIDFGSEFGVRRALLHHLPQPLTPKLLHGRFVFGAVYPVWSLKGTVAHIAILGISRQPIHTATLLPGSLLPLGPDLSGPFTLPKRAAQKMFEQYCSLPHESTFRFEPLQEYLGPLISEPSFEAWQQGQHLRAKAMVEYESTKQVAWIRKEHNQADTKKRLRIRIIDDVLSPFQQWEMEYFRRINIPLAKETIYLLPRKALKSTTVPEGDLILFGNSHAVINSGSSKHLTHRTFHDSSQGHDIRLLVGLKNQLFKLALTKGQLLV
ncbi:MAG TPA: serine hydrolase [Patescibacteria group bacterium]|jgi:D-alanyl-D-alanine carboxypeptidase|nr:serine hydrolase [Patescibacteria group bacterium]